MRRRPFLASVGVVGSGWIAGCSSGRSDSAEQDPGTTTPEWPIPEGGQVRVNEPYEVPGSGLRVKASYWAAKEDIPYVEEGTGDVKPLEALGNYLMTYSATFSNSGESAIEIPDYGAFELWINGTTYEQRTELPSGVEWEQLRETNREFSLRVPYWENPLDREQIEPGESINVAFFFMPYRMENIRYPYLRWSPEQLDTPVFLGIF